MHLDPHSYSEPENVVVKHLQLELKANFESKILSGFASWQFENKSASDSIIFDTRDLNIEKVIVQGQEAVFTLSAAKDVFGQKLSIKIPKGASELRIYYKTTPQAAALQWLNAEQTAGKKFPFLFSQSQAILCRSWIPCQDSPGIRFTYQAKIEVPKQFIALMSATNPQQKNEQGLYTFMQEKPIPAYLMALAVGDLEFKNLGEHTGVYAEANTLDKAVYEFGQMEAMLQAAEKLYGPYAWGRYDVLVLPPSFPFGGMENPCLTFATPTILAGDRSLVSLVAHELAHSWSGNLVTNATWNDFWLNEGFTVYFERRIMEAIEGKDYADMLTEIGRGDLQETMHEMGADNKDTQLKLELNGRNPDDGMNDIAYEKGFFLLKIIEQKVGREKFDAFLKKYFSDHAFQTATTEQFLSYLKAELFKNNEAGYSELKIEDWVYKPGLPGNFPEVKSKRFEQVTIAALQFENGKLPMAEHTKKWSSHEWLFFLRSVAGFINKNQMAELDQHFHFSESGNNEILALWLELSIKKDYRPALPYLEKFLSHVGRRKFLMPLYKALLKTSDGAVLAKSIYAKARSGYHAVAVESLDKLMPM